MKILIFSAFRSGSNYARSLLEKNYDVETYYNLLGWKHGPVPSVTNGSELQYPSLKNIYFLAIVKNPYATLVSWFNYAKMKNHNMKTEAESFSEFLSFPIIYFNEDEEGSPEYYFSSPMHMWNFIVWNHCSFTDKNNGYVVRYEDLLSEPEETAQAIADKVGLKRKSNDFDYIAQRVKNMGDSKRQRQNKDYFTNKVFDKKNYFTEAKYLQEYSGDEINLVKKELIQSLMTRFCYD